MPERTDEILAAADRWMQAWVNRDQAVLDDSLAHDFALVLSASPAQRLDRAAWLATATTRYTCSEFRYRDVQVRELGPETAVMSSIADFTATIDGVPRCGPLFIVDVWRLQPDGRWRVSARYTGHREPAGASSAAVQALR